MGLLPDGSLEVNGSVREEYNSLIDRFGDGYFPPLEKDKGIKAIENGNYSMTLQANDLWYDLQLKAERERINKAK